MKMIICKIEADGIWVADSNWGYGSDLYDRKPKGEGDYLKIDGKFIEASKATEQQRQDATESYAPAEDETVRYRFVSYKDLDPPPEAPIKAKVKDATIYRIKQ